MRVPLTWLSDFVDLSGHEPQQLSEKLTIGLCEVEKVEEATVPFSKVVVGKLLDVQPHPDAEKLNVATVDVGQEENLQIVCGAPNIAAGQTVPVALVGAKLPTENEGETFKIKKSKIRGVPSFGMLCSQRELGMGEDHEGILQLDGSLTQGTPFEKTLDQEAVLDIDNKSLTHRSDCWGLHGLGREMAAILGKPFIDYSDNQLASIPDLPSLNILNEAPEGCLRYHALKVTGLEVKPSPEAWVTRLEAAGLRSINNIVDATNLTLLETAQPLHAFDQRQIKNEAIMIRFAKEGESMVTLDEQERQLVTSDLLICDADRALALAGIMGGDNSAVSEDTTEIILEGANFAPGLIRHTSMRLGLRSDSSARFEKGLAPALVELGLRRCIALLKESCPKAEVKSGLGTYEAPEDTTIDLTLNNVNVRLGQTLSMSDVEDKLSSIGMRLNAEGEGWKVTIPSWRTPKDLFQPADLIEEVGRLCGYDKVEALLPSGRNEAATIDPIRQVERKLRRVLVEQCAATEVINYSFSSEKHREWTGVSGIEHIVLKNPVQEGHDCMRQNLFGGLIDNLFHNHRTTESIRLFEIGRVTFPVDNSDFPAIEERRVAGLTREGETSFNAAKGQIEAVLDAWNLPKISWRRPENVPAWAHPGRCAQAVLPYGKNPKVFALVAEVHPKILNEDSVAGRAAAWEVILPELMNFKGPQLKFAELPKYPAVLRDISLVVDEEVSLEEVENTLKKGRKTLVKAELFDIYRGKGLDNNKKSFAFHLHWQSPHKTLTDKEIEKEMNGLIDNIQKQGWERR